MAAVAAGGALFSAGVAPALVPPSLSRLTFDPPTGTDITAFFGQTMKDAAALQAPTREPDPQASLVTRAWASP